MPSAAMATPSPWASPTAFRSTRPASVQLPANRSAGPMECEALPGAQDDPCPVRGDGSIGNPFGLGSLPRCARLAHTFELMGCAWSQFSWESVQPDRVRFTFRHDEEAAVWGDEEGFRVVCAVGYVAWNVSLTATESSVEGFRDTMNRDALALGLVVANVRDVDARASGTSSDRHGLPIVDFHARHPDSPCHRSSSVERHEHGVAGIVVRPQTPR